MLLGRMIALPYSLSLTLQIPPLRARPLLQMFLGRMIALSSDFMAGGEEAVERYVKNRSEVSVLRAAQYGRAMPFVRAAFVRGNLCALCRFMGRLQLTREACVNRISDAQCFGGELDFLFGWGGVIIPRASKLCAIASQSLGRKTCKCMPINDVFRRVRARTCQTIGRKTCRYSLRLVGRKTQTSVPILAPSTGGGWILGSQVVHAHVSLGGCTREMYLCDHK